MSYRFTGFFARPDLAAPTLVLPYAVWREITAPFVGVGLRVTGLANDESAPDEAQRLLADVGLSDAADWLYLHYSTWAGQIECVYGLGVVAGQSFGPVRDDSRNGTRQAFLQLMANFGIAPADALAFPPFVRGFWGE
ncbi:MAG: hypothetical protein FJ304_00835 [Planctomycetes bacterium]|nr:hypothetical protein [Planctomycetota bacterium]